MHGEQQQEEPHKGQSLSEQGPDASLCHGWAPSGGCTSARGGGGCWPGGGGIGTTGRGGGVWVAGAGAWGCTAGGCTGGERCARIWAAAGHTGQASSP